MEIIINTLERRTSDGFVITAHWRCNAVDGEFYDSVYATASFDGEPVTPYNALTQAQVLEWVWASGVDKQATEEALVAQIEAQKNPPIAPGLPWGV